ncbi:MAG: 1-deoxy-D-xylulose-5-phosphate reductoisomerase [Planctomycetota bacterium]
MSSPRRLVILGATGTVGIQALSILEESSSPLEVVALSCHQQAEKLANLGPADALRFHTIQPEQNAALLAFLEEGNYDVCLHAIVGAAGLPFSEAVLKAGRRLALANKESLVMAGDLLMPLARKTGAEIVPVDSEHSAIHQCLVGAQNADVRHLWLTASGGALRDLPISELEKVTPNQALAHPNWDMGPRITVDSATMMNKAFEIIEACFLFDIAAAEVKVLLHRQSVVHSMVEFVDGSMLAQLGPPDMSLPIHYAIHFPERRASPLQGFDAKLFSNLTFEEPNVARYPALDLGWRAASMGGNAGAVLNAADEVAVEAFLAGEIPYLRIAELCQTALEQLGGDPIPNLTAVYAADQRARDFVADLLTTPNCS